MNHTCKVCKGDFYSPHDFDICSGCHHHWSDLPQEERNQYIKSKESNVSGQKFDEGKLRFDLIPAEVTKELAKVLTYGANKYSEQGWKAVEAKRYVAALHRHLNAFQSGETHDEESNIHHLSHALTNVAFLLYFEIKNKDLPLPGSFLTENDLDNMFEEMERSKNKEDETIKARKDAYFNDDGSTNCI